MYKLIRLKVCLPLLLSAVLLLLHNYVFREHTEFADQNDDSMPPSRSVTGQYLVIDPKQEGTDVLEQQQCVAVNITQFMDVSMVDGYRMNLICTALTNIETDPINIRIHWSGVGLKSMWVHQLPVSQQGNKYERQLSFRPWLDVHAGKYTCHVMSSHCTVEKSIEVKSGYRGLVNSRRTTDKFTYDSHMTNSYAWFPNVNLCGEENVWKDYAAFHHSVITGQQLGKYLVYDCTGGVCGGYGNRIHGIAILLMFAILTRRVFVIQMTKPVDINLHLLPNAIQWNYRPPARLKSKSFNLHGIKNFNLNYKTFETILIGHDSKYDLIKVQIDFGLFYYLVAMNDHLFTKMITTFQLKTQYDCVMMYGCAFNYLFKYQPETIKSIEAMQSKLGLETGKFVSLHVRSHINDGWVFNPLHLEFPWQPMFECALKASKSLSHKMNISKVPIFLATDHEKVIDYAHKYFKNDVIVSQAPKFHIDHARYSGHKAVSQYSNGILGILSDVEILSRAAVLVRAADSTMSEVISAIHFPLPQHNLHPFYFYEESSICEQ